MEDAQPKINMAKLHFYCFGLGMFFMQMGWAICGNNQPGAVVRYKLNIDQHEWDSTYNRIVTSSSILGMMVGAIIATSLITYGRRILLLYFGVLAVIGTAMTLIVNVWVITAGRFLHGLSVGIFMAAGPRMLDETVPIHLLGSFGVYTNVYANLGVLLCLLLGLGLPQGENPTDAELADNTFWRVCYGMPIPLLLIGMGIMMTVFTEDSINFNLQQGKRENAIALITQIYDEDSEAMYAKLKSSVQSEDEGQSVSFGEAACGEEYRYATWYCFVLTFFHQNTGLNAINIYSNTMIRKLNEDGGFPLTPVQATYFIGIFGFIGACLGPFVISRMKRKQNFLYGHSTMGISMITMGFLKIYKAYVPLFCFICLYAILFQTSQGAMIWIYTSEVTQSSAGGLMVLGIFGFLFLQTMTLETMMDSWMQPEGVFFMFGIITIIGFFYILCLMKETSGLTDFEKKTLYTPKNLRPHADSRVELLNTHEKEVN